MAQSFTISRALPAFAIALIALIAPVYGQITTACNPTMLSNFSPCINFISNSTTNGTSPSSDCCNSLKTITSSSTDCLCQIVTGSVPFQIPINRTLAISLPRACNMPGVPLQCKASASPAPAPGPAALAPATSPSAFSPTASNVPEAVTPSTNAMTPEADATPALTPPTTTTTSEAPTTNSGSKPVVNPSAANHSHSLSPAFLLAVVGATLFKYYY